MASKSYHSKRKRKHSKHRDRSSKRLKEGAPAVDASAEDDLAQLSSQNPADAASILTLFENNIKSSVIRTAVPVGTTDVNTSNFWQFNVKTSKHEFVKFHENSLSFTLFGTYDNPTPSATAAKDTEGGAARHALRAHSSKPSIQMDPTMKGAAFISSVDVAVNNVNCPTNALLSPHFPHYARMSGIFRKKPELFYATASQMNPDPLKKEQ